MRFDKEGGKEGLRVGGRVGKPGGAFHLYLHVGACDELGIHHIRLDEERFPQLGLRDTETLRYGRQVPRGLDGRLGGEEEED